MKHARKPSPSKKDELEKKFNNDHKAKTTADYRRKYLYEDSSDVVRRQIQNAGYQKRSLDNYIPKDKLESRVRPMRTSSRNIDDTRNIDSARINRLAGTMSSSHRAEASKSARKPVSKEPQKRTSAAAPKRSTVSKHPTKAETAPKSKTPRNSTSKKAKKTKRRIMGKIVKILVLFMLIAVVIVSGILLGMYNAVKKEIHDMNFQNLAFNYSSSIYYIDENGNAVQETQLHYEGERRVWADSEDISINLKNAAVAIEDERFYKHNGVDLGRTFTATVKWGLSKVGIGDATYGGSTITQQLVKNITNEKDKSAARKIKELMRAMALESEINDKDKILTMYLNISYFGNRCNGVEAASNLYFSKSAKDVTIAEAATIVGITQRPSYYDPITNPDNALNKRNTVLAKMKELKYITKDEYEEAVNSPLGLSMSNIEAKATVHSYFVDQVVSDVIKDLVNEKGYSQAFAEQQVYSGGLSIYTTMDKNVQEAMESVYENRTGFPANTGPQSAMVVLDPKTGEVKGIVGGAGVKTEARGLNRATQTTRQPGSSIKPISVYAPGLETKVINSATVLKDESITIDDWSPSNSYSGFKGNMVISKCVEISANIPAVKALQTLGINKSYDFAKNKFHLSTIVESDKNLSCLALGGLTNGVTVQDMAGAYGALANGGVYIEPHTYTKVVDSTGKVLLEKEPQTERAVSEATAFIMTDMLETVITGSSGTGKAARLNNMTAYGKTGTTNDSKDKWFAGYTKYYVGVVWFGFDTPKDLKSVGIRNNPSCEIWKNVMNKIHEGLPNEAIEKPESVKQATICSNTGNLASAGCSFARTGYFASGALPTKFCKNEHIGLPSPSPDVTTSPGSEDPTASPAGTPAPSAAPEPTETPAQPPIDAVDIG
ncbi:MAG: PBP1A family penicillin-binding protein [Clostridia bacterium]|nr:PBP1A family penicillin-binding protein [Clostridia bacterium]